MVIILAIVLIGTLTAWLLPVSKKAKILILITTLLIAVGLFLAFGLMFTLVFGDRVGA